MNEANEMEGSKSSGKSAQMPAKYALCGSKLCKLEAVNEEAIDYVLHFCGLECYAKWRKHEQKQEASE